jgi:quinohemoprotein ethanol dehydrogenase
MHHSSRALSIVAVLLAGALAAGCQRDQSAASQQTEKPVAPAAVDQQRMLAANSEAELGNWLSVGRTYDEQRFSPLDHINVDNVKQLGLAWYYDFNSMRGLESSPLVIDGVMYNVGPWNVVVALDAESGRELWRYDPRVDRARARYLCCDVVNRGLAAWKGRIYFTTIDGRVIALDAATGKQAWSEQSFDLAWPYTSTGATRVFDGKVVIGNAGGEYGVRGYVTAYDADTGKQLWRFYTVPGDPAKGFENKTLEMAAKTWNGEWWKRGGGGTAWDSIVYDPELNLIYIGVGNGSPHSANQRSPGGGDNLFLASIVAVNADTGEYVWHYQEVPGDHWDFTATQPMILADLRIDGAARKVVMHAPKNGYFYVIDRTNGKLISAQSYLPVQKWASHVDLQTGRPAIYPQARYGKDPVMLTPSVAGGHNWHPMAYSPLTGLAYFPAQEHWWVFGEGPMTKERAEMMKEAQAREKGWLTAWDPVKQKEAWRVEHQRAGNGGILATAGNLIFQGTAAKTFAAFRADTGEKVWEQHVDQVPMAGPVTYTIDGQQFIAVNAGWGGGMAMAELRGGRDMHRSTSRTLVFKLGGTATLPPLAPPAPVPAPPPSTAAQASIDKGRELYAKTCAQCHGQQAVGGGVIADLRHLTPEKHKLFDDIVLKGIFVGMGMGNFSDVLSQEDADAVHAYLIARANEDYKGP